MLVWNLIQLRMIDFYSLVNHIYLSIGESSYLHRVMHVNKSSLIPVNIYTYKYHLCLQRGVCVKARVNLILKSAWVIWWCMWIVGCGASFDLWFIARHVSSRAPVQLIKITVQRTRWPIFSRNIAADRCETTVNLISAMRSHNIR